VTVARGRTPFKAQERDRRYKAIIEAAAAHPLQWQGGISSRPVHQIPITFPDRKTASRHADMIYIEARYQGYGRTVIKTERPDGTWTLGFRLFSKEEAQAYVAAGRNGQGLAYNTRRQRKET
jgi:hypothetical protein